MIIGYFFKEMHSICFKLYDTFSKIVKISKLMKILIIFLQNFIQSNFTASKFSKKWKNGLSNLKFLIF